MSGRHPFSELTKDFTPERRRRIDEMKREFAEFPEGEVAITNFSEVGEVRDTSQKGGTRMRAD